MDKSIMQMCADEIAERNKKISDLEAKLAEYEKVMKKNGFIDLEDLQDCIDNMYDESKCAKQVAELKAKLAESEKMIDKWSTEYNQTTSLVDTLNQQLSEKEKGIEELKAYKKGAYEKYVSKCDYLQQQILDFTISKLEKVKEYNKTLVYSSSLIDKFIDQQIAELKGEK